MRRGENKLSSNRIISALDPSDFNALKPHLESVDLPLRRKLEIFQRRIDYIYFIDSGIASVVATGARKSSIEVGIIGLEGCTGLSVLMGADRAPHDVYMQVAGAGRRMKTAELLQAVSKNPSLQRTLLKFSHVFALQTAYTALANGRCTIEERLARWLLMAQDRVLGDALPMTHEFLALMLGVRRPGVTLALQTLEEDGLVRGKRGVIEILDRNGLLKTSSGAYGAPEAELKRLFG